MTPLKNRRIVANHDVMCNLALVINDHAIANNSVIQRAAIDGCAGTDLHAIANNYATNLWDLHPVTTIVGITKAVCAYHCSGLDQAILTDLDLMVNGYVRPETRTCTDFAVFTYEANPTPIITLSPSSTPDSITALAPIDTLLPSFAVASITALGAMFCAGCGVVSKICAMRA